MTNKNPKGIGGRAKVPKRKISERYARSTPIKEQLKGMECSRHKVAIVENAKGKKFKECEKCGAFLGWA